MFLLTRFYIQLGTKVNSYIVIGTNTCVCRMVHISEATRQHLKTEYTFSVGNGVERDSFLKLQNVKTYLITPVERKVCC